MSVAVPPCLQVTTSLTLNTSCTMPTSATKARSIGNSPLRGLSFPTGRSKAALKRLRKKANKDKLAAPASAAGVTWLTKEGSEEVGSPPIIVIPKSLTDSERKRVRSDKADKADTPVQPLQMQPEPSAEEAAATKRARKKAKLEAKQVAKRAREVAAEAAIDEAERKETKKLKKKQKALLATKAEADAQLAADAATVKASSHHINNTAPRTHLHLAS